MCFLQLTLLRSSTSFQNFPSCRRHQNRCFSSAGLISESLRRLGTFRSLFLLFSQLPPPGGEAGWGQRLVMANNPISQRLPLTAAA